MGNKLGKGDLLYFDANGESVQGAKRGAEEACILDIRRTWPIRSVRGIAAANFYAVSNSTNENFHCDSLRSLQVLRRYILKYRKVNVLNVESDDMMLLRRARWTV